MCQNIVRMFHVQNWIFHQMLEVKDRSESSFFAFFLGAIQFTNQCEDARFQYDGTTV